MLVSAESIFSGLTLLLIGGIRLAEVLVLSYEYNRVEHALNDRAAEGVRV